MIDYLTHYYSVDKEPFRSLSALSDEEAIKIMEKLCDDTPYGERFKNPIQYLKDRKDKVMSESNHTSERCIDASLVNVRNDVLMLLLLIAERCIDV